jgi:hypothetical protein
MEIRAITTVRTIEGSLRIDKRSLINLLLIVLAGVTLIGASR